ncbi:MAG: PKD domain-containing protein [Bacteroidetes bacterium]|nr:PKD domain-containing protein [Bacteroidota bacterium]
MKKFVQRFIMPVLPALYMLNAFCQVGFTYSPPGGCAPLEITFTNTSSEGVYFRWYFGDGSSYWQGQDTSHTYQYAGGYSVYLQAYDEYWNYIDSYSEWITIGGQPESFYMNLEYACPGTAVEFWVDLDLYSLNWNFGDGSTSNDNYLDHIYTTTGEYVVTLDITNSCGSYTLKDTIIISDDLPFTGYLGWSAYPQEACPGDQVEFYGWNDQAVSYLWDFGDGSSSTGGNTAHSYSSAGTYTVNLTLTNGCGNDTVITDAVYVSDSTPINDYVEIYYYPQMACPGDMMDFYVSNDEYYTLLWDFGDGTTSAETNPYHAYSALGIYNVSVTLTNNCGMDSTIYTVVEMSDDTPVLPVFYYYISTDMTCPGDHIYFEVYDWYGNNYSYSWDLGDGTTSGQNYFSHVYPDPGIYNVELTVTNGCGNDSIINFDIVIDANLPVDPDFSMYVSHTSVCPGEMVWFGADYGYASYQWNFGDGSTGTLDEAMHYYQAAGTYTVSLTVMNDCNNDTTIYQTIVVAGDNPVHNEVYLEYYPYGPYCPGETVWFYSDYGYSSYLWNFGDGNTSSQANPEHSYASAGTYTVALTYTNSCGNDSVLTTQITVNDNLVPYTPDIGFNTYSACPNVGVNFYAYDDYANYLWDFGDGATSQEQSPVHAYSVAGNYTVSLTVTNHCGNTATSTESYTVNGNTGIEYNYMDIWQEPACPGTYVYFEYYDENVISYTWNLGDGTISTDEYVVHSYPATGNYPVTLTVINGCGYQATITDTVHVQNDVPADNNYYEAFIIPEDGICPGDTLSVIVYPAGNTYSCDFGDGTTSIQSTQFTTPDGFLVDIINHAYQTEGIYNVSLTVTNTCGNSTMYDMYAYVVGFADVYAELEYDHSVSYNIGDEIEFFAYGGSAYQWNFGDGTTTSTTGALSTVIHSYSAAGAYTITLTVSNNCGASEIYSETIVIGSQLYEKKITSFSFNGVNPPAQGVINQVTRTIEVTVPNGTGLTNLIASYTSSPNTTVIVNSVPQISGTTVNDFTNPIVYRVIAPDASYADYTVTVTEASVSASSEKAITYFAFEYLNPVVGASINETAKTIIAEVPAGTDRSAMIATFTNSAASTVTVNGSVQTSGVSVNNFSAPVQYAVIAENGSTTAYTVTVSIVGSIAESVAAGFSVLVYPNPGDGDFTLVVAGSSCSDVMINVFDIRGQHLFSQKYIRKEKISARLDLTDSAPGVYYCRITKGQETVVKRIVVR